MNCVRSEVLPDVINVASHGFPAVNHALFGTAPLNDTESSGVLFFLKIPQSISEEVRDD